MGFNRREFIKTVAIGGGAVLSASELFEFLAQADGRGPLPAREGQRWALGVCGLCDGNCGLLGRIVGERLVRLRGAPFHPLSRGGICPRGAAGPQLLYHPQRLLTPLKRSGERGQGKFRPITWKQAEAELATHLKDPSDLVMVAPRAKGQIAGLRRAVLPGATFLEHRPYYEVSSIDPAYYMCQGIWGHPAYDLENADFILSFDSELLERFWHPCETFRSYGRARDTRNCRLVQIESRRSLTGTKSDMWVPLHPGTEATLALGIAHVMIKEGLVNRAFVSDHTFGYDDWKDAKGNTHQGFRSLVLKQFDPRSVADATSVPIEVMIRVARRFAGARRPVALGCNLPGVQGPHTRMAIHCLNALVGAIERPGGVLAPHVNRVNPFESEARADQADPGQGPPLAGPAGPDAETMLAEMRNGPRTLIFSEANVIGEAVDRERVKRTVAKSGFVVAMANLPDATVDHADLVLPLASYLERFMDVWDTTGNGFPFVSLSEPMLKPLGKSRAEADIWFAVAKRAGRKLPADSYGGLLKQAMKKVYKLGTGQLFGIEHHEAWVQALERSGWRPPRATDFDSFWSGALKVGGWWDPVYYHYEWKRALSTPSGKFEFFSQSLQSLLQTTASTPRDLDLLPHQDPMQPPARDFPLVLEIHTPGTVGGLAGRLSWLRSMAGSYVNMEWDTWVELNPATATQLGLSKGARARVRSKHGAIEVTVVHSAATPPNIAVIPCGLLATDTDPRPGADPLQLVKPDVEPLTGHQRRGSTRVAIEPV